MKYNYSTCISLHVHCSSLLISKFPQGKDDQEDLRDSLYEAGFTLFLITVRFQDFDKECGNPSEYSLLFRN